MTKALDTQRRNVAAALEADVRASKVPRKLRLKPEELASARRLAIAYPMHLALVYSQDKPWLHIIPFKQEQQVAAE